MIIAIGSTNPIKVQAVEETLNDYPIFTGAQFFPFSVPSNVSEQPLTLEEIITGAKNRARKAFELCKSCDYAFGLESGLFEAKGTMTGYLEACICCIYDGNKDHCGLSCGFELPPFILKHVLEHDMDLNQACNEAGVTKNAKLGSSEGLVGILTNGRVVRKAYTKQCIVTAMVQIEHHEWYKR
jgi:inosine/xanthosine triphosphatase